MCFEKTDAYVGRCGLMMMMMKRFRGDLKSAFAPYLPGCAGKESMASKRDIRLW